VLIKLIPVELLFFYFRYMIKKPLTFLSLPSLGDIEHILSKFPFPISLIEGQFKNLKMVIRNNSIEFFHGDLDIKDFSFVWLTSGWINRETAYALHLYLVEHQTPHSDVEKSTSKVTDTMTFGLAGLPLPNTVFLNTRDIVSDIPLIKEVCGFPLIIKDAKGSCGKYSELVRHERELVETLASLPDDRRFLFQEFVENDYDWGVMVANGVVVSGEKSYGADGEFRNNLANGASEVFVSVDEIPENIKEIAIEACASLGLSWSRADVIIDKATGNPYLLEVNRYPSAAHETEAQGAFEFLSSHIGTAVR